MTKSALVLATDKVAGKGLAPFTDGDFEVRVVDTGSSDFEALLPDARALIVRSATNVDEGMIGRALNLEAIGRAGVGVDNIDVAAASAKGIAVFNAPGGNTVAAAEMTMALILAVVRFVPQADRSVREGLWDRAAFKGSELKGKTLGLIGAGRIGAEVAVRCRSFGMEVVAFDPYLTPERAAAIGIEMVGLDEVISRGDVISIHVPLNEETRGMISAPVLKRMKNGSYLVNVSRGGVIEESALAEALTSGHLAGAGLDVFEEEPLPADSPLRAAPNLVLTPHLGASTAEAQVSVAVEVAMSLRHAMETGDFSSALNAAQLNS